MDLVKLQITRTREYTYPMTLSYPLPELLPIAGISRLFLLGLVTNLATVHLER